ncbi:acyl-CoA dehydrogenase [Desulfosporosinus acidiphilus SJ4]|uniref:Acyl-CoA dehydrogenase n=1 Tax=Desulfosporosinus acidiphilus (strain DSM 22704 / JCM 16185 / SJ4) TaxID=646529 RepID=I4D5P3_DESAJ|nr:acyl-CoA dehydrogenase family protein [Desulfosporosinus acidiphilus]AFM41117.1 acyl-CoA dehydrogenase [Desulfosporosinus acidiphilus SJ4]
MFGLTEDQKSIRTMVRSFADEVVEPGAEERDRTGEFPMEIVKRMGELGLLGLPFSEAVGGTGGDTVSYALAVEEITRVCASTGITYAALLSLGISPIYYFGNSEQKAKYLPSLFSGKYLAAFGLTEPGAGSDSGGTKTKARKTDKGWVLNGSKCFITNASYSGVVTVTAVTDPGKGTRGISSFLVEPGTPGFQINTPYEKMGLCASNTTELVFEDVEIPAENLLGELNNGFRQFMQILDGGRISIGAMGVGIAQGALDKALKYSMERKQFGKTLSSFQAIQFKLADMLTQTELSRLMILRAASLKDANLPFGQESAMGKLHSSETAVKNSLEAIQIHGGYGYMKDYHVERYLRDAKLLEIGEGTSEILRMVISRKMGCR